MQLREYVRNQQNKTRKVNGRKEWCPLNQESPVKNPFCYRKRKERKGVIARQTRKEKRMGVVVQKLGHTDEANGPSQAHQRRRSSKEKKEREGSRQKGRAKSVIVRQFAQRG